MIDRIWVFDPEQCCQELAEIYANFAITSNPDQAHVHILPTQVDLSYERSDCFTVFVDTEPAVADAHWCYNEQRQARPRHIWAVSAHSDSCAWPESTVDFFSNMLYVARLNRHLDPVCLAPAPWLATCLLGGWMPARQIMLAELIHRGLDQRCLITHLCRDQRVRDSDSDTQYTNYRTPALQQLDLPVFQSLACYDGAFNTMRSLGSRHGQGWISQLVPRQIYQSALVSIVSETVNLAAPDTFYISEKISRPILMAQPFWVLGCKGFLSRMRDLGFRTYAQWWDESYDHEQDLDQRARAVIASFSDFAALSADRQMDIVSQARAVALHNRARMLDLSWHYRDLAQAIRDHV